MADIKRGKIVFVDDQASTITPFVDHLREEGFTNVVHYSDVKTLAQLEQAEPDLVFLDIGGVATTLAPTEEGLSLLRHLKRVVPWTRIVVLSGSTFPASKVPDLALADKCRTKGALSLAELTSLVRDELQQALAPEWRNPRLASVLVERMEGLSVGTIRRWRVKRLLGKAIANKGNDEFDWPAFTEKARKLLSVVTELTGIITLFV